MEVTMKIRILIVIVLMSFPGFIKARVIHKSKEKAALGLVKKTGQNNRIKITKAYHHKGTISDKLVFHFSRRPVCAYVPSASSAGLNGEEVSVGANGQIELEFSMPSTQAEKKVYQFLSQLEATQQEEDNLYRVKIEPDYAKGGLTCRVVFRPDAIGFQQESFEPISGGHGLTFSFLKRQSMKALNNKSRPILQTAQVKKKSMLRLIAVTELMTQVL